MFYYCLNCGNKNLQKCSYCENISRSNKLLSKVYHIESVIGELMIFFPNNKILQITNLVGIPRKIKKITTVLKCHCSIGWCHCDSLYNQDIDVDIDNTFNNLSDNVVSINCSSNKISLLDNLPKHLVDLNCSSNSISHLDKLPEHLDRLNCSSNNISQLDNLPSQLTKLNCSKNKIVNLDQLSNKLIYLDCSYNNIKQLDNLPSSLQYLFTTGNKIYSYMYLPVELKQLNLVKYENKESKQLIEKHTQIYKNYMYK